MRRLLGQNLHYATCTEDLRVMAKSFVPRPFYDYVDSGSWTESTYRNNHEEFSKIFLKQQVLIDISNRSIRSKMLNQDVAMPIALAPCGFGGMQCANGEIKAALAAEKFGVPFILSTMSINSIEDVAEKTTKPFWFQLYVMKDREFVMNLIDRAKAAKCSALVLTADLQVLGQRHRDIKNGLSAPPKPTLQSVYDILTKPFWCLDMLSSKRYSFGNIVGHAKSVTNMSSLSAWTSEQFDPSLSWKDVSWIKERWGGRLILKGIMDPEDARRAVDAGADAVVVSNHGGRQLDGAPPSIAALPAVANALAGTRTEVWVDGGIYSGQDVLKAVALGARAALVGRPWLYGLGAGGEAGVTKCLQIIHKELDLSMGFTGRTRLADIGPDILLRRHPTRPASFLPWLPDNSP